MMIGIQADQMVISLRPGGRAKRSSMLLVARFESAAFGAARGSPTDALRSHGVAATVDARFSGDNHVRYTRDQLLQFKENVDVREAVTKIKQGLGLDYLKNKAGLVVTKHTKSISVVILSQTIGVGVDSQDNCPMMVMVINAKSMLRI